VHRLAASDRGVERRNGGFPFVIVTDHWLLEPGQVEGFQRSAEVDGLRHAKLLIGVDHQPDSGPIASRTARTRATIASAFPGATRILTVRKPAATKSKASRCNSSIEEESHKPPLA
jgi:hypothetical protein